MFKTIAAGEINYKTEKVSATKDLKLIKESTNCFDRT